MTPKISVCIITYNHECFIGQAIESVIMQEVDFSYEIVIGEDCSTDRTRDICIEYQKKYPEKIRLLARPNNLGMMENFIQTINDCRGQYIALLEGDDYWTSKHKLRVQADFLDTHIDFSICTHDVAVLDMTTGEITDTVPAHGGREILDLKYLLCNGSGGATCSIMYRNRIFGDYPEIFKQIRGGDVPLQILCTSKGKMKYFPESMGVYRIHDRGSLYQLKIEAKEQNLSAEELLLSNMLYMNDIIHRYFGYRYLKLIHRSNAYAYWLASQNFYSQQSYFKAYKYYLKAMRGLIPFPNWFKFQVFYIYTINLLIGPYITFCKNLLGIIDSCPQDNSKISGEK